MHPCSAAAWLCSPATGPCCTTPPPGWSSRASPPSRPRWPRSETTCRRRCSTRPARSRCTASPPTLAWSRRGSPLHGRETLLGVVAEGQRPILLDQRKADLALVGEPDVHVPGHLVALDLDVAHVEVERQPALPPSVPVLAFLGERLRQPGRDERAHLLVVRLPVALVRRLAKDPVHLEVVPVRLAK